MSHAIKSTRGWD